MDSPWFAQDLQWLANFKFLKNSKILSTWSKTALIITVFADSNYTEQRRIQDFPKGCADPVGGAKVWCSDFAEN